MRRNVAHGYDLLRVSGPPKGQCKQIYERRDTTSNVYNALDDDDGRCWSMWDTEKGNTSNKHDFDDNLNTSYRQSYNKAEIICRLLMQ